MEKKNLGNTLKDHSTVSKASSNINFPKTDNFISSSHNKLKYPWGYREDYLANFSWPPRSYTCSFCKREFRSAQALGGHMNVHRRDRARLRQSPPHPNPNPNPNPNQSHNSLASSSVSGLCSTALLGASSSTRTTAFDIASNFKARKSCLDGNGEFEDGRKFVKKAEILRLDLEIGLSNYSKDDLDLELRLGY